MAPFWLCLPQTVPCLRQGSTSYWHGRCALLHCTALTFQQGSPVAPHGLGCQDGKYCAPHVCCSRPERLQHACQHAAAARSASQCSLCAAACLEQDSSLALVSQPCCCGHVCRWRQPCIAAGLDPLRAALHVEGSPKWQPGITAPYGPSARFTLSKGVSNAQASNVQMAAIFN